MVNFHRPSHIFVVYGIMEHLVNNFYILILQVEYVNMSQSINKVGQILKDHCEEDNKAYQRSVAQTEEESKSIIAQNVQNLTKQPSILDN